MTQIINVRPSVLTAALDLARSAEFIAGAAPFHMAAEKSDERRAAGDEAGTQFWREVSLYLLSVEVLPGSVTSVKKTAMTPSEFSNIGRLLYGERWKTGLARQLGVSRITVHRWADGAYPLPEDFAAHVHHLAWEKYKDLEKLFVSATS